MHNMQRACASTACAECLQARSKISPSLPHSTLRGTPLGEGTVPGAATGVEAAAWRSGGYGSPPPRPPPLPPVAGVKRRRVTTLRWQAHALWASSTTRCAGGEAQRRDVGDVRGGAPHPCGAPPATGPPRGGEPINHPSRNPRHPSILVGGVGQRRGAP